MTNGAKDSAPASKAWPASKVERRRVDELIPYARNARTHSPIQVAQLAGSIKEWGWTIPVLIDETGGIIAGHGRVMAARKLELDEIPVMVARGWTDAQKRAYVIADNKLALNAGWDEEALKLEVTDLSNGAFDMTLTGFSDKEVAALAGGDINFGGDADESRGILPDLFCFGKYVIQITPDETAMMDALADRYVEETSSTAGFADWICEGGHVS